MHESGNCTKVLHQHRHLHNHCLFHEHTETRLKYKNLTLLTMTTSDCSFPGSRMAFTVLILQSLI